MQIYRSTVSAYLILGGVWLGLFLFCVYAAISIHTDFWGVAGVAGLALLVTLLWLAFFGKRITEDELIFRSPCGGRRRIKRNNIESLRLGVGLGGGRLLRLFVKPKERSAQELSINAKVSSSHAIRAVLELGERVAAARSGGLEDGLVVGAIRKRRSAMNRRDQQLRNRFRPLLCAILIALAPGFAAGADDHCKALTIFQVYDELLPMRNEAAQSIQRVVVRYVPGDTSRASELRAVLQELSDGRLSMKVARPAPSIQQQLRALRTARPQECDEVLLSAIAIPEYEVTGKTVADLYRSFRSVRVPVSMESAIYLDASRYEISVETPMNSSMFVLYGPTLQSRRPHPLLKWAASVVSAAESARRSR